MPLFREEKKSQGRDINTDMLRWVQESYLQGINALQELRESSRKWYDYVQGDMIDSSDEAKLKKKGLPVIKLNIILPKILRVMGAERKARAGVKAIPLRGGKSETARALTKLFEKIRVDSDGFRQIRDAFIDAVISDLGGWLEVVWTNDNDPLGQPIYRSVNPFYIVWDAASQRYDLSDARWIMKTWWASKEDILRDFPEKVSEVNEYLQVSTGNRVAGFMQAAWERIRGAKESVDSQFVNTKENLFRIIEAQIREEVREVRLFDPVTQAVERVDDKEELAIMKAQFPRLIEVDFKWDRIRIVTTVGGNLLFLQDEPADVQNGMFSLIPIWAYNFGGKPFGMVRNMAAGQDLFWKETSSALHITNAIANPVWMVPKGSLEEREKKALEQYGARTGYVMEYDAIQGQRPHRDFINAPVLGKLTLADRGQQNTEEVSGVGQNAVGRSDSQQESGVLVQRRIAETLAMLEGLFDNKMRSIVMLHQYLIALSQTKMTATRIVRFIGDDKPEQFPINLMTAHGIINDLKDGEYGIAIEKGEAQFFRQEKFLKLAALVNVIGANPELMEMIIGTIDDISDDEKERLLKSIREQHVLPQLQQMQQELLSQAKNRDDANVRQTEAETKRLAEISKVASTAV